MKKEIREANKGTRARVKELKAQDELLLKENEKITAQGQAMNQKLAQNNTQRLKLIGAIEELERTVA